MRDKRLILLHPDDNVLVLAEDLRANTPITIDGDTVTLRQDVAIAHKIARCDLRAGDKIIKYGAPIGSTRHPIQRAEHVHTHNLASDYLHSHDRHAPSDLLT